MTWMWHQSPKLHFFVCLINFACRPHICSLKFRSWPERKRVFLVVFVLDVRYARTQLTALVRLPSTLYMWLWMGHSRTVARTHGRKQIRRHAHMRANVTQAVSICYYIRWYRIDTAIVPVAIPNSRISHTNDDIRTFAVCIIRTCGVLLAVVVVNVVRPDTPLSVFLWTPLRVSPWLSYRYDDRSHGAKL